MATLNEGVHMGRKELWGDYVPPSYEKPDTLTLLYPKYGERIQTARAEGRTDEEISSALMNFESRALEHYSPQELSTYLGRTSEGMKTIRAYTERTKLDAYERAFEGTMNRQEIEKRVEAAHLLQVSEDLLLNNDDLYRSLSPEIEKNRVAYAEQQAKESPVRDILRRGLHGVASGATRTVSSFARAARYAVANADFMSRAQDSFADELLLTADATGDEKARALGNAMKQSAQNRPAQTLQNNFATIGNVAEGIAADISDMALQGRDPTLFDNTASALGSVAMYFIPGTAAAKAANAGRVGQAIAFGASKGGLESLSEGGEVYDSLIKQGVGEEDALAASRLVAISQMPLNMFTDAIGAFFAGNGSVVRGVLGRGVGEFVQEPLQGILSEYMSEVKLDGTPHTIGDLIRDIPMLAKKFPGAAVEEGIPAFLAGALLGGGEVAVQKITQNVAQVQAEQGADFAVAPDGVVMTPEQADSEAGRARSTLGESPSARREPFVAGPDTNTVVREETDQSREVSTPNTSTLESNSPNESGARADDLFTESGRSIADAEPSELIVKSDGSAALGTIDDAVATEAGIQPGEIHANVGMIRHTEEAHGEQIKKAGYPDAKSMVEDVLSNYSEIREGRDGSLLLVKRAEGTKSPTMAVELVQEEGSYRAKTAWLAREDYIKKRKLLSTRSATPVTGPDSGLASLPEAPNSQGEPRRWSASQENNFNENSVASESGSVNENTQALTSNSQRFFEPEMPTMSDTTTGEPVTIADIRARIEKLLPWRRGKTGRGNLGIFKIDSEVARTKLRNDVPAVMHELGHFLDKRLGLSETTNTAAQQELASAGAVASTAAYTEEQVRAEGVAQFFLHYAINEDQAKTQFPEYYKAFKEKIAQESELQADVDAVVERVSAYYRQSPADRLRANIVRGTDPRPFAPREIAARAGRRAYDMLVDSMAPLQRVTEDVRQRLPEDQLVNGKYLPDELNLYARARTAAGFMGKADQDIKPFLDVLRGLEKGDHAALSNYLAAQRAQDYRTHKMEPGLGVSSAEEQRIIEETPDRVKKAADDLRDLFQKTVRETLVETGIMSQEQYDYLREKWPHYVPFFRMDTPAMLEGDIAAFIGGRGKKLVNLPNPVKKATGVRDAAEVYPIRDPLETMIQNIGTFHSLAARNEVGKTMVNISQVEGMGEFAERVDGPGEKGDNIFSVWNDGVREYFATDPDVYRALTAVNESASSSSVMQKAMKILTVPAEAFKMGTTRYNPAFIVRNFLRDTVNTAILSESWAPPIINTAKGIISQFSNDPKMMAIMEEAINEGVLRAGITEIRGNSPRALARQIENAFKEGGMTADTRRKVGALRNYVGSWNEAIEIAPKLHEYYHLREQGVPKQEAAMRAREVNIDFARAGSAGRQINRSVAFFNAKIQGVDKAIRTAANHPMRTMAKVTMWGTIPSVVSWALANLFGDEQERKEYEEIPRSMKGNFWFFKVGGAWVRLPKPDVFGLVGSLVERVLDAAYKKDAAAFRSFGDSIKDEFVPSIVPTALLPVYEAWANKSTFTGRAIVSEKYQDLPPEMQYGPYTSGIARALGDLATVSPMMIDHLIQGYGGTMGSLIVSAANPLLGTQEREAAKLTEGVLARSIFANPYRNSESMDRFYELMERTSHARTRFTARRGEGGVNKDVRFAGLFSDAGKQIAGMRKARAAIQQNPNMDPQEKRYRMDVLDALMVDVARKALETYDRFDG